MDARWPDYYTTLAPFLGRFRGRAPILTYHKLGPRPRGVRMKGLYVSAGLFRRQLRELSQAGFANRSLADDVFGGGEGVAITFDDGHVNTLRHGLGPLSEFGFKAIQFLPAGLLGKTNEWDVAQGEVSEPIMDAAQIRDWLAAGHDIGSHTKTHVWLTRVGLDTAREEITASKKMLEDLFSRHIEHFCYPYGDFNERIADMAQEAGYSTACTTRTGLNEHGGNPFLLKRFTARYQSLNFKALFSRFFQ